MLCISKVAKLEVWTRLVFAWIATYVDTHWNLSYKHLATSQNHIRAKMFLQCIAICMHTEFKMPISKLASYSRNSHPIIYTQCSWSWATLYTAYLVNTKFSKLEIMQIGRNLIWQTGWYEYTILHNTCDYINN